MTNTPLIRPSVHLLVSKLSVNHLQEKHDQTDHGKASSSSVRKHKDRIKVLKDQEKSLYGLGVGLGAYGISPLAEGVSKSPNIVGLDKHFHGTSKEFAEKIKRRGLRPSHGGKKGGTSSFGFAPKDIFSSELVEDPERKKGWTKASRGKVHVTPHKSIAGDFAKQQVKKKGGAGEVIKAYTSIADRTLFKEDPFFLLTDQASTTEKVIPPSRISGSRASKKLKRARLLKDMKRGVLSKQYPKALVKSGGKLAIGALLAAGAYKSIQAAMKGGRLRKAEQKKLEKLTSNSITNLLSVINGGPGSGHHGHKGIKGQRGGSLPDGASSPSGRTNTRALTVRAPLSETPQARAKRAKNVFTKTSKLADIYGTYADELDRKKSKLIVTKSKAAQLAGLHAEASSNFYSSADQATLIKGSTREDQIARLKEGDRHAQLAMKYNKKATGRKIPGGGFARSVAKSFVKELSGSAAESLGKAGADIAREGIRGGFKQAIKEKDREPETRRVRQVSDFGPAKYKTEEVRPSIRKSIQSISKAAGEAAKSETTRRQRKFLSPDVSLVEDMEASKRSDKRVQDALDLANQLDKMRGGKGQFGRGRSSERNKSGKEPTNLEAYPLEFITANLSTGVRKETLDGREYLVAPLSMIVPGVLAGSKGALLYPEEEVSKNPTAWNHMPIVVNHPMKDGRPVEARDPEILEKYQVGTVFNARYEGKLIAEGWFDVEKTRRTNVGIYDQLINNQPIELSTGLHTDNHPFEGTWNGRAYKYVARNYRPDHLAILLGSKGACSIKDGCGVLVNKSDEQISSEVQELVERLTSNYRQIAQALQVGKRLGSTGLAGAKRTGKFIKKKPKTSAAIGLAGAYKVGQHRERKKPLKVKVVNHAKHDQSTHKGSSKAAKWGKRAGGFAGGAASAAGGAAAGGKLGLAAGTALAPFTGGLSVPIGTIGGAAAGAAGGAWGAHKAAKKIGGKHAGQGAVAGGIAGSLLTPGGVLKTLARTLGFKGAAKGSAVAGSRATRAVKALRSSRKAARPGALKAQRAGFRAKKIGAEVGKHAVDVGAFGGTTAGLEKLSRRGKRPPTRNVWTDEARRKSAETRRRNAKSRNTKIATGGAAAATGIFVGRTLSRTVDPKALRKSAGSGVRKTHGAVRKSFGSTVEYTRDPTRGRNIISRRPAGVGRKTLRLLKKLRPRAKTAARVIRGVL